VLPPTGRSLAHNVVVPDDDWRMRMQPRTDYRPPAATGSGWGRSHRERHDYRYWDGTAWTNRVVDAGEEGSDDPDPDAWPPVLLFPSSPADAVFRAHVAVSGVLADPGGVEGECDLVASSGLCSIDAVRLLIRSPSLSPVHEPAYQLLADRYAVHREDGRFSFVNSRLSFVHRADSRVDVTISLRRSTADTIQEQLTRSGFASV